MPGRAGDGHSLDVVGGQMKNKVMRYPPTGSQVAFARLATALAVVSVGALSVGAVAIGRIAIRRLALQKGAIDKLTINELTVKRLRVQEVIATPATAEIGGAPTASTEMFPRT